jgi:hypothetical protein
MAEVNQGYQILSHPNGTANPMLGLSPKSGEKFCFSKLGGPSGRFSMRWLGRKNARFWKVM